LRLYDETCLISNTTQTSYPFSRAVFSASSWAARVLMERERCSKRNGEPPFLRTLNSTSVTVECCLGMGCFDFEGARSRPSARRISTSVSFASVKRDP